MSISEFASQILPQVESTMQRSILRADTPETKELQSMLTYHMGWSGQGAGPEVRGKRIRPMLVLLSFASLRPGSPDWSAALPAAASVELLHNFSLIHDDIQDNSDLRRGRPTVWKNWGIPQAINAGDSLFTLAYLTLLDLSKTHSAALSLAAQDILLRTTIALTQGQHLDLAFEQRRDVSLGEYWAMICGKTAALIAACTELGALTGGAPPAQQAAFREFGRSLGLAFQVQDDYLGVWGDERLTGKSAGGDLVAGKKSLPVIYGLSQGEGFAARWQAGPISDAEAPQVAAMLAEEGARAFVESEAAAFTARALGSLEEAGPQGPGGKLLVELANSLLKRQA